MELPQKLAREDRSKHAAVKHAQRINITGREPQKVVLSLWNASSASSYASEGAVPSVTPTVSAVASVLALVGAVTSTSLDSVAA